MQALHQELGSVPRVADAGALKRPARAAARCSRRAAPVRAAVPALTPKGTVMDDQVELGKTGLAVLSYICICQAALSQCTYLAASMDVLKPSGDPGAGIKVNSLAIGAWQWGDASFWGFNSYGKYGEDEIRQEL